MIVLDTNVLSEILKNTPNTGVVAWIENESQSSLFTTAITRAEVFYGIHILPEGRRKQTLFTAVQDIFRLDLAGRVLAFDDDAADCYAQIAAARKANGSPISQFDAMIAAITLSRGATLATRNIKDFIGCGVQLINPWTA